MLNIIAKRNIFFTISSIMVALSAAALIIFGLKPSIDFTGGSQMAVIFTTVRPELSAIQSTLSTVPEVGSILVQPSGEKGYSLKLRFITEDEHQKILSKIKSVHETADNKVIEERIQTIGPAVSSTLKKRSIMAIFAVALTVILYVAYSFRNVSHPVQSWKFGISTIISLIHNVGITVGIFAILGRFYDVQVDIPFVVALLTILGYSVNDNIVVLDRIRENLIRRKVNDFALLANNALNETLWRSLNTSFTILLVFIALLVYGDESIFTFSLALILGIIISAYSSVFLAAPLLVAWEKWDRSK
ncbi:MAG: protein-export membrane protein SecF [Candidatus Magasanikbacteria bacterium RIFCSPHIGHO2_01_FULL_41_23]|uniref:Protein-export membrane protein SecF n=1 Tax=Candidatus Magasanikbacteria bacterium RIFCSPLOWO2_01_FULL_40_15 TaxID=1798686 RepID=A0A1F6N3Q4_9BACT|nr:MAG: protein-export membrane protein SecF [Candidatus Magasanikbacteria bacterium RIFCSPHIGHO2_01_FULL_41_23]OGH76571.1 MAG: protein-export membrane protein SecF [Candidatus Magasanikbacteria bacterium RIFCSPHIGHO2_12_FULL_41_16]OGH78549.1 MAG: protein-export membrane protein SecF [Candidatus Magasanikbacteria bacterium RIFCSPLOWO2_01_FULL_40_15]